jgi:NAD(P)-dependent dehydrogenase (short-subunit alcohol dehydrogenase family)
MASPEQVFDAHTTTDELLEGVDLTGSVVLVTGASAGIGLETARVLATHGATVIAAVRDVGKAEAALAEVGIGTDHDVTIEQVDLASLASVRAFTDRIAADHDHLDLLIANAGLMACPQAKTADGFDLQFGTNHLGHFVFVNRLLPIVVNGDASRVVMLTSLGHRYDDLDFDDLNVEEDYTPFGAYHRSKTANILYAAELDRRYRDQGLRACAVHPGTIDETDIQRHLSQASIDLMHAHRRHTKTMESGAATQVWAAVVADADAVGGTFCEDCHVAPVNDLDEMTPEGRTGVKSYALDPRRSARLWAVSEELVGERFPDPTSDNR